MIAANATGTLTRPRSSDLGILRTREEFDNAFQIITEGDNAKISGEMKRRLFGADWAREMRAVQDQADDWINTPAVQGLAVGTRSRDGRPTDELVIVVYVDRKRPPANVRKPVPGRIRIPGLGDFKTDVVAIGRMAPLEFSDYVRPAMPGCSIGHVDLDGYGTFGLLVRKQAAQAPGLFILSNSHVLAMDGLAAVGDDIVQPGPADIDGESGTIAKLDDWVPFDFKATGWPNLVDAAIARVVRSDWVTNSIREINIVPVATSFKITKGMRVRKVGRSSGEMWGEVKNPSFNLRHKHMKTSTTRRYVRYADQVLCDRFAGPGDSGSIVLNERREVVGLCAAGSPSRASFNKIEHVFSALGITLP